MHVYMNALSTKPCVKSKAVGDGYTSKAQGNPQRRHCVLVALSADSLKVMGKQQQVHLRRQPGPSEQQPHCHQKPTPTAALKQKAQQCGGHGRAQRVRDSQVCRCFRYKFWILIFFFSPF